MEFWKRGFCVFVVDVLCSYQRYDKPVVLDRCLSCSHYLRANREIEEEEDKFFDEVDKIRKGEIEWFSS